VIVEVKQRALDKINPNEKNPRKKVRIINEQGKLLTKKKEPKRNPKNKNALRAQTQIGGYTGLSEEVVRKRDFENRKNPDYVAAKNPVEGYLVAYEVQGDLFDFLQAQPNRGVFPIEREEVESYIQQFIPSIKEIEKEAQKEARKVAKRKKSEREKTHEARESNFKMLMETIEKDGFIQQMQGSEPSDLYPLTVYRDENGEDLLVHTDPTTKQVIAVYSLNGVRSHNHIIDSLVREGKIRECNKHKYFDESPGIAGRERIPI
jgi:hypothetical protein